MADITPLTGPFELWKAVGMSQMFVHPTNGDKAVFYVRNSVSDLIAYHTNNLTAGASATWSTTSIDALDCYWVKGVSSWGASGNDTDTEIFFAYIRNNGTTDGLYFSRWDIDTQTELQNTILDGFHSNVGTNEQTASVGIGVSRDLSVVIGWQGSDASFTDTVRAARAEPYSFGAMAVDLFEDINQGDDAWGFPATTADNDICFVYEDNSASEISVKMYDWSADTFTETSVMTSHYKTPATLDRATFSAVHNNNDRKIYIVGQTTPLGSTSDKKAYVVTPDSIASPTVTGLTDVLTDTAETAGCALTLDVTNDVLYCVYNKGTTIGSLVKTFYKSSDDGGTTWSAETALSEDAEDDLACIMGNEVVYATGEAVPLALWENRDTGAVYYNWTNAVTLTSGGGAAGGGMLLLGVG